MYLLALDGDCSPANMKADLKKSGLSGILKNIRMYLAVDPVFGIIH